MGELKVQCSKMNCSSQGETMTYDDFVNKHVNACLDKKVECPICKSEPVSLADVELHYMNCQLVIAQCELCKENFLKQDLDFHLMYTCQESLIKCSNMCSKLIKRKDQKHHELFDCLEVVVKCLNEGCEDRIVRKEQNNSHNEICPYLKLRC